MTATREPPRLRTLDRGEVVPVLAARLEALDGKRVEGLAVTLSLSLDGTRTVREVMLDDRAPAREDG